MLPNAAINIGRCSVLKFINLLAKLRSEQVSVEYQEVRNIIQSLVISTLLT